MQDRRSWGIAPPLYVPTDLPPRKSSASFWTIIVPLLLSAVISMAGLGFLAMAHLGDIVQAWVTK